MINTSFNFIKKILTISNNLFHHKNTTIIYKTLQNNSLPNFLIKNLIHKFYNTTNNEKQNNNNTYKSVVYVPQI